MTLPIFYSFRRCPYAIRARLALAYCQCNCEIREVELANKPLALIAASSKATVPVLCLSTGEVLDESLDIMRWAAACGDYRLDSHLENHLDTQALEHHLVDDNDTQFKYWLDRYKYFERYPEQSQQHYWNELAPLLGQLNQHLNANQAGIPSLVAPTPSLIDWAVLPFVRQCYLVDRARFDALAPPELNHWLKVHLRSEHFANVMRKAPFWYAKGDHTYTLLET